MATAEQQRKIRDIGERVMKRLEEQWPEGEAHLNEIEDLAKQVSNELAREVTEEIIGEQSGRRKGNHTGCPCGGQAVYRGQYWSTWVTGQGRIATKRAYFYCSDCGEGHCPIDAEWGIGTANTTPSVQALVGAFAAEVPYTQVMRLLGRTGAPIHLGVKSVELIAQGVGKRVAAKPPRRTGKAEGVLAVAVDAAILLTRGQGKEARCGVIYEPEWEGGRTPEVEAGRRKEYFGTLESRDTLIKSVCEQVERRRRTPETKVTALGDGAPWIWRGYAQHLPSRVEILDFYHVVEHLSVVAAAWHGEGSQKARIWVAEMKGALQGGGPDTLLRSMRAWKPGTAAAKRVKTRELAYFRKNRERMKYHVYLAQELPIGSGAVEGACKFLVGARFKGVGMRWNPATAEPLLQLRAALLSFPDLDLRSYAGRHMLA